MPKLVKTSVQLEPDVIHDLEIMYSALSRSEIIRLALDYVLARRPRLERSHDVFTDEVRDA